MDKDSVRNYKLALFLKGLENSKKGIHNRNYVSLLA